MATALLEVMLAEVVPELERAVPVVATPVSLAVIVIAVPPVQVAEAIAISGLVAVVLEVRVEVKELALCHGACACGRSCLYV